ncbi:hypothetical protein TELCIR_20411, partial [Teladorsagia circumcincta]
MYLYGHLRTDEGPLRWEHRWPILEQELIRLNADILGLQEVQYDHYDSCFRSSMSRGQVLRLRCKKTGQELIYANTHLIFNSARGDIKIGQLAMLFANIIDELSKSPCPVIINGDLNIEPLSYVYTYISES